MRTEDMVLVSVDDHVVEPPDLFKGRLPAKYADLAPEFVTKEDGTNVWRYEGTEVGNVALNAVAGRPKEEYGIEPTSFAELRAGCYDINERVKDMDANGVLGSLCFPSFPQFCGQLFARTKDKDVALAMIRAYNDWHIDEWCGSQPGRFIPLALPAIWDPETLAAEVRRTAAKGAHAVTFSENPSKLGWPSMHSDHWDPFWKACSDEGVVACMHIGSSSQMVITSDDAPIDCLITLTPINIVQAATDLIWSPIFRKFPDVRVALSEGGIGWIPYFLERIDYQYRQHHTWTGQDFGDRLPSEVFDEHVLTCFIDDRFGVASRDFLNMDNVMWECDYPHSDSTWPFSPEELAGYFEGVSDHDVDRMTHANAMRHFSYDPFPILGGRENCTVGALRAKVTGHDVSIRSTKPKAAATGPVRSMDLGANVSRTPAGGALGLSSGRGTMMLFALRFDLRNPALAGTSMAERYDTAIEMAEWADRLGCVSIAISEHHGSDDGYLPSPIPMIAAMGARTSTVRFNIAALVAPFYEPIRLAEDLLVLDNLTKGRVDLVIGGGYVSDEFAMYGVSTKERVGRITEVVSTLRGAFSGEAFTYRDRTVRLTPSPYSPGIAITMGGSSEGAARRAARIGDGFIPSVPEVWDFYRDEVQKLGRPDPGPSIIGENRVVALATDVDRGWADMAPFFRHESNAYGLWQAQEQVASPYRMVTDDEELRASGQYAVLTPEQLIQELKDGPFPFTLLHPLCGGMPPELAWSSLRLFENEVLPAFT